ncbi:hypothetical protein KEM55_005772 [Ascosphaera atra]|nr:hypothetical protein KEM55_005772 [Ascosphaera atra]
MSPLRRRGGDLIFDTMFPSSSPAQKLNVEAVSGICGSISIACWVVVFSPQIIENFRRQNADGLSLLFLTIWLIGDVFNILGSVLQNVLPTMIILAVYYTLADIVLLLQCLYYRGLLPYFTKHGIAHPHDATAAAVNGGEGRNSSGNNDAVESSRERSPLLNSSNQEDELRHRRRSFRERIASFDGAHLSPTVPMVEP